MPHPDHRYRDARLLTSPEELIDLRRRFDQEKRSVVTINGCFDLIHSGHLYILEAAAAQGDILIVGLNSDESVRLNKGEGRPILPQFERAALLLALRAVDYVYVFPEKDCMEFVRLARPHAHVNDASYGPDCIEAETVRQVGGRLHLVERRPCISTSEIIRRITELYDRLGRNP